MKNMYIHKAGYEFRRVNKAYARRLYNYGFSVLCVPHNLNAGSPFVGMYNLNRKDAQIKFEMAVKIYENQRCVDTKTGRYTAFYMPVKQVDAFTGGDVTKDTINTLDAYNTSFFTQWEE